MVLQKQQRGMSLFGWVIVLGVFGIFVVVGVKSMPVYLNHFKIVSIMKSVSGQSDAATDSPDAIRKTIDKRFDVDMVSHIEAKDVKVVADSSGKGRKLVVDYEVRIPMVYNIDFVYKFKEEDFMGGSANSGGAAN